MIRWLHAAVASLFCLAAATAHGQACTTTISPGADLNATVAGAAANAVICLNVGTYLPSNVAFPADSATFAIGNSVTVRGLGATPAQVILQGAASTDYTMKFVNPTVGKTASGSTLQ